MSEARPLTILCLASYEKGADFLRECKRQGCYVILITVEKLADAGWPRESIDELICLPDLSDRRAVIYTVSYLARTRMIDRVVALEDYDVETAATLREHLRCPGMGDTTSRYFRDKLAMRSKADEAGIAVPPFCPVLNYDQLRDYMGRVPSPWLLKPRSEAGAVGIKKVHAAEELWPFLDELGDRQSFFLLEQYIDGDVYHVDSVVFKKQVVFAEAHKYGSPPIEVVHEGGLFVSRTLPRESTDAETLLALNRQVLQELGFVRGVAHTEFIKAREDRRFYFLETSARVGGAYLVELVRAATGVNLWVEWAKIEIAGSEGHFIAPISKQDYSGIIISLARQEHPDTSEYNDPEIIWRLDHKHHAGLIVVSSDPSRVELLLDSYTPRFYNDFYATQPAPDKPTS